MTTLHARNGLHLTEQLRSVLAEANGRPHNMDIAVGYFYSSDFADQLPALHSRGASASAA